MEVTLTDFDSIRKKAMASQQGSSSRSGAVAFDESTDIREESTPTEETPTSSAPFAEMKSTGSPPQPEEEEASSRAAEAAARTPVAPRRESSIRVDNGSLGRRPSRRYSMARMTSSASLLARSASVASSNATTSDVENRHNNTSLMDASGQLGGREEGQGKTTPKRDVPALSSSAVASTSTATRKSVFSAAREVRSATKAAGRLKRPAAVNAVRRASVSPHLQHATTTSPKSAGQQQQQQQQQQSVSQAHPTALPDELLTMTRQFRSSVESFASNPAVPAEAAEDVNERLNAVLRYVSHFVIKKHASEQEILRQLEHGWASERDSVDSRADIVGPLVVQSLYMLLTSLTHVCRCDRGSIFVPTATRQQLVTAVMVGGSSAQLPIRIPIFVGIAGKVFRTGVAINIEDTDRVPPTVFKRVVDSKTGYYTRNMLCFPIFDVTDPKRVIGVMQLLNKARSDVFRSGFTPEDEVAAHQAAKHIAFLLHFAGGVDLTGATAASKSYEMQELLAQRKAFVPDGSHRLYSAAGCREMTYLEAKKLQQWQKQQENKLEKAANDDLPFHDDLVLASERVSRDVTLVHRMGQMTTTDPVAATEAAIPAGNEEMRKEVVRIRDVSEVTSTLRRTEEAWKDSRDRVVNYEHMLTDLKRQLHDTQVYAKQLEGLVEAHRREALWDREAEAVLEPDDNAFERELAAIEESVRLRYLDAQ